MNNELKVLIIAVILLFSAGPLVWFFSSPAVKELPAPSGPPAQKQGGLVSAMPVNVTVVIEDIDPHLSFTGVSSRDLSDVSDILLSEVMQDYNLSNNSYSVSTTLNPNGVGYKYYVTLSGFNKSLMTVIGFRAFYRMSAVFSEPSFPPAALARVRLASPLLEAANRTLNYTGQSFLAGVPVLYSRHENQTIILACNAVLVAGKPKSLNSCHDTGIRKDDPFLGLPVSDALLSENKFSNESLLAVSQNETGLLASFSGNLTEEQVRQAFNWTTVYSLDVHNNSFAAVIAPVSSDSQEAKLNSSLQELSARLVSLDWNTRFMLKKEKLTLEGKEYRILNPFFSGWVSSRLDPGENASFRTQFSVLHDEVIRIGLAS